MLFLKRYCLDYIIIFQSNDNDLTLFVIDSMEMHYLNLIYENTPIIRFKMLH